MLEKVVVVLAALTWPVLGGSRAWEAPLSHQVQLDRHRFDAIPVDEAGYAVPRIAENGTTGSNVKRWVSMRPGVGDKPSYLWPDKTINYCFDTTDSRDKLDEKLNSAFNMWAASFEDGSGGLNRLLYKYSMVAEPGTACTENSQRAKILVVSHNDLGVHSTTIGQRPLDAERPEYKGPTMKLSTRDDVGQLNILANFAHEVGHAWGLIHEHQNPLFWRYPYGTSSDDIFEGTVFGDHWECSALRDYYTVRGKITQKHGTGEEAEQIMRDVCLLQSAADEWGFSAADWLPVKANFKYSSSVPNAGADYTHVDWDSIMLYPSGAGGRGTARPPTNPSENPDAYDQRTPVLLRNDGVKIHTNAIPSKGDVEGIKALYENSMPGEQGKTYVLPNDKKSSRFGSFIKDFSLKKKKNCPNPNS
ncbi:hypothetical protein CI238_06531 [Colletotrichum incanum]|uniref:Uncharacterized protein n=1 Tax=Colletotrichum incanum TaxID=1573173 RepID=A0A167AK38_COLIC|nr:hypothetical protein CI238_06531 [Colletotrichum incanum]